MNWPVGRLISISHLTTLCLWALPPGRRKNYVVSDGDAADGSGSHDRAGGLRIALGSQRPGSVARGRNFAGAAQRNGRRLLPASRILAWQIAVRFIGRNLCSARCAFLQIACRRGGCSLVLRIFTPNWLPDSCPLVRLRSLLTILMLSVGFGQASPKLTFEKS